MSVGTVTQAGSGKAGGKEWEIQSNVVFCDQCRKGRGGWYFWLLLSPGDATAKDH